MPCAHTVTRVARLRDRVTGLQYNQKEMTGIRRTIARGRFVGGIGRWGRCASSAGSGSPHAGITVRALYPQSILKGEKKSKNDRRRTRHCHYDLCILRSYTSNFECALFAGYARHYLLGISEEAKEFFHLSFKCWP